MDFKKEIEGLQLPAIKVEVETQTLIKLILVGLSIVILSVIFIRATAAPANG